MRPLSAELEQQPESLRDCIDYYLHREGSQLLEAIPSGLSPVLTGMGASYHAAWIGALHLSHLGDPALSLEATDLVFYAAPMLGPRQLLVYFSQSGASAEVGPLLAHSGGSTVVAISNNSDSQLAQAADFFLPLLAGEEHLVASKTYLSSLALAWPLARRLAGAPREPESGQLDLIANRCEQLVRDRSTSLARWQEALQDAQRLVFVGHGPHTATARQAAMLVNEWAKQPAVAFSAGGLRHGFIESAGPGDGFVLFASPGPGQPSILALANELQRYGVRVLLISNGAACLPGADCLPGAMPPTGPVVDEFLSPILDILPIQHYIDHTAQQAGITPSFRHIQKVITRL